MFLHVYSKLKHLLGSTTSLFCLYIYTYHMLNCKQLLIDDSTQQSENQNFILSKSYFFSHVIIFVRLMMMLTYNTSYHGDQSICDFGCEFKWLQRVVIFPHNYLELYTSFTIMRLTFISWIFIKFANFSLFFK